MPEPLDRYEKRILTLLQQDASLSTAAIAEQVGLSSSPCWRRIDRLEREGFIKRKVALVDRRKIGLNAQIFAQIKLNAHGRANLDDARIKALAAKGGAICMSTIYLSPMNLTDARAKLFDEYEHIAELDPKAQAELVRQWRELDKTEQMWSTTFEQYMNALLHVIEVAGVDHVCFGADWDGGGGIQGMEDISALPTVTARLLKAGYSRDDVNKMTGGNVLRILGEAQAAAGR